MKKVVLLVPFLFSIIVAKAQSPEFSVQAYSGISHYTGATTVHSTFLNSPDANTHAGYPNGTGNIYAPDFGAGAQLQYNFKCNFLIGAQADFEQFSSKVDINENNANEVYYTPLGATVPYFSQTGHVTDHADYININPYFGYRFIINKVKFDVLPGFDVAIGIHGYETVNVKESDGAYYNRSSLQPGKPSGDFRLRMGLAAYYKRLGIQASFSKGVYNYNSGALSDSVLPPLHTELFRLGLAYRIN